MPLQYLIQQNGNFYLAFIATIFKPGHTTDSQNLTQCLEWALNQTFSANCAKASTFVFIHLLWTLCNQNAVCMTKQVHKRMNVYST